MNSKPLICLIGATATGKTSFSIKLAKYLKKIGKACEIINTDSLLFYRELNIGTAKPTLNERQGQPHHLIDICSIEHPLNASQFEIKARKIIGDLHEQEKIPLLVGGSGFYVRALIKGMYESPGPSQEIREKVSALSLFDKRSLLKDKDIDSYHSIHENDDYRTSRALEHILTHHTLFSELKRKTQENGPYDFSRPQNIEWNVHTLYLNYDKEQHWEVMEKRAKQMIDSGLVEEVRSLLKQGFSPKLSPLSSIGYKETISFLNQSDPELKSSKDLVHRIYLNTRRLAKSQKTFFSKVGPKYTLDPQTVNDTDLEKLFKKISLSFT